MTADEINKKLLQYVDKAQTVTLKQMELEGDKSIKLNFKEQGRPEKWQPKKKPDGRAILSGKTGMLLIQSTAVADYSSSKVKLVSNLIYSKVQNDGGKFTPARPFLVIPPVDYDRILSNCAKVINSIKI